MDERVKHVTATLRHFYICLIFLVCFIKIYMNLCCNLSTFMVQHSSCDSSCLTWRRETRPAVCDGDGL